MLKRLFETRHGAGRVGFVCLLWVAMAAPLCMAQVDAITMASYDLKMGFTVSGKLSKVAVEAGDQVKAGQLLMELEDNEGQAMVLQYTLKANSDLAIRSAQEQARLAEVEQKAIKQLYDKNAATPIEVERAVVKAAIAQLNVKTAQQELEETKHQLAQAVARHAKYQLRSPIDGVVDSLVVRVGETVESLKPVLRLVNTHVLYIDAAVPTNQTMNLKPGDPAWIHFKILPDAPPDMGKILYLAQVADSASDTRIVRIQTPNPRGLPAGGTVTVRFDAPKPTAQAPSTTADHRSASIAPVTTPEATATSTSGSGTTSRRGAGGGQ